MTTPRPNNATTRRDLLWLCIAMAAAAVISIHFELSETLLAWTRPWERYQLDELPGMLLFLALGLAWTLAAVGVFLRDITQVTPFVTTAILFASAVFYSTDRIRATPLAWEILRFNPLLQIIDIARHVLLWQDAMPWSRLGYVYAAGLAALLFGNFCFGVLRRSFAEVI